MGFILIAALAFGLLLLLLFSWSPSRTIKQPLHPGVESSPVCSAQLLVSRPGQVLGIPRGLVPVAQEARLEIRDLVTDSVLFQAVASETGQKPGIWLLTKDGQSVAFLDTEHALLDPRTATNPDLRLAKETGRRVILHRVVGGEQSYFSWSGFTPRGDVGEPFAIFVLNASSGGGAVVAQRFAARGLTAGPAGRSKFLLSVNLDAYGQVVAVTDKNGKYLASTQADKTVYSARGEQPGSGVLITHHREEHPGATILALMPNVDTVLILAAVMSVQKLHPYFTV